MVVSKDKEKEIFDVDGLTLRDRMKGREKRLLYVYLATVLATTYNL